MSNQEAASALSIASLERFGEFFEFLQIANVQKS
jgi:hypothetical protein